MITLSDWMELLFSGSANLGLSCRLKCSSDRKFVQVTKPH